MQKMLEIREPCDGQIDKFRLASVSDLNRRNGASEHPIGVKFLMIPMTEKPPAADDAGAVVADDIDVPLSHANEFALEMGIPGRSFTRACGIPIAGSRRPAHAKKTFSLRARSTFGEWSAHYNGMDERKILADNDHSLLPDMATNRS